MARPRTTGRWEFSSTNVFAGACARLSIRARVVRTTALHVSTTSHGWRAVGRARGTRQEHSGLQEGDGGAAGLRGDRLSRCKSRCKQLPFCRQETTPCVISVIALEQSASSRHRSIHLSLSRDLKDLLCSTTPFAANNYLSTYDKILAYAKHGRLRWPTPVSAEVQSLILGLVRHPAA